MRASESGRGVVCPASLVMLRTKRPPHETRDRAANFGTLAHYWKETGETDPPWADPRDTRTLEKKLLMSGIERDEWYPPGGGQHEVTFALHLETVKLWMFDDEKKKVERDEWKRGFPGSAWLTGTIDWVDWGDGKTVALVDDLKTGRWPVDPATSLQLRSYALVPWIAAGMPMGWDGLVSITQWEKYPLAGLPRRTTHRLTALDLAEHLGDLQYAACHPNEVNPTDEGCKFCDCKPACPAWVDGDVDLFDDRELATT